MVTINSPSTFSFATLQGQLCISTLYTPPLTFPPPPATLPATIRPREDVT